MEKKHIDEISLRELREEDMAPSNRNKRTQRITMASLLKSTNYSKHQCQPGHCGTVS